MAALSVHLHKNNDNSVNLDMLAGNVLLYSAVLDNFNYEALLKTIAIQFETSRKEFNLNSIIIKNTRDEMSKTV